MPGDWKQIIQEKAIEAAAITAFNYVPGLAAKGITLARKGIEWVFGGRNEAESEQESWIVIDPIANKKRANKKRRRLGRQRMTAELGEIEEEEERHEFCLGAGGPRVVGNESRSVSSKRKERGYCNYNYDDLMILRSRGLEDPQRSCTYEYGDDGRFTLTYSNTTPLLKWTYPGTVGSGLPFTFVSFNGFEGGRTCLRLKGSCMGSTTEAVLGTESCKLIHVLHILPRPYMLTVDAWADSSSGRWTFVFSVLPLPSDFDGLKFFTDAVRGRIGFPGPHVKFFTRAVGGRIGFPGPHVNIISSENKIEIEKVTREDILWALDYKIENFSMLSIGSVCRRDLASQSLLQSLLHSLLLLLSQWLSLLLSLSQRQSRSLARLQQQVRLVSPALAQALERALARSPVPPLPPPPPSLKVIPELLKVEVLVDAFDSSDLAVRAMILQLLEVIVDLPSTKI